MTEILIAEEAFMGSKSLTKIKIHPTGMRLHEWICLEERFFEQQGLDVEVLWGVVHNKMRAWQDGEQGYKKRPQDIPFLDKEQVITNACAWGSICNAGAGMGKFVPDAFGIPRHAIFVRPESSIMKPEDLKDVPISVGYMAGSHYNVPYRLEKYLPLEHIKIAPVGGHGRRLEVLLNKEVEAASLLDPEIYMAEELGLRKIMSGDFNTLWWVDERYDPAVLQAFFTALDRAEQALTKDLEKYLPLWKYSIPPEFQNREWRVETWGPGERFVFRPFPKEEYTKVVAAMDRWGFGSHMQERNYDRLVLSLQ
jgi:hypothetical protein